MGAYKGNSRKTGMKYEQKAVAFLEKKGYQIIKRNFCCKYGEIDIIAKRHEYLVFVEVKFRNSYTMGSALEAITYGKQQKIIRTAKYYIYKNKIFDCPCRFDVIAFDRENVSHMENAFEVNF